MNICVHWNHSNWYIVMSGDASVYLTRDDIDDLFSNGSAACRSGDGSHVTYDGGEITFFAPVEMEQITLEQVLEKLKNPKSLGGI